MTRSVPRPCKGPADVITSEMAAPLGPGSLTINLIIPWRMRRSRSKRVDFNIGYETAKFARRSGLGTK